MPKSFNNIYWIASYPKSGNTWLRKMLDSYYFNQPASLDVNWQYVKSDTAPSSLQSVSVAPITCLSPEEKMYLRPAQLLSVAHTAIYEGVIATLKTHSANLPLFGIPLIPEMLTSGAIYLVRDPRDIAVSYANHNNQDIDDAIKLMGEKKTILDPKHHGGVTALFDWSSHVRSWLNPELHKHYGVQVVKYEDMLKKPHEILEGVVRCLGLGVDQERLKMAAESSSFDSLKKQEEENGFIESPDGVTFFKRGTSGYWREVLTEEQVRQIESNHGPEMKMLGYELTEEALTPVA